MWSFKKEEIVILTLIGILLLVNFFMIQGFIVPLLFTLILVYILNPIYEKLNKIFRNKSVTSMFITLMILIIIVIPITYGIIELSKEINKIEDIQISNSLNILDNILVDKVDINFNSVYQYNMLIEKLKNFVTSILYKIPKIIFNIFIVLFFYYYFSKNYKKEMHFFKYIFESRKFNYLKKELTKLINGIIYGQILVRFVQGLIGTLGFILIGVHGAILWGIMMFFTGFIPMFGTGIIWVPLACLYFIKGNISLSILIIIIGIIISVIDNILLPYIISGKTKIGPIFTLISIIGGIELFGIYGLILGPFVMGFLFVMLEQMFIEIRNANPKLRKYIWTEKERNEFRDLDYDIERAEFIENINKKYELKK